MEIECLTTLVRTIPGFLTEAEGELLYRLAESCSGKGVIVEIGSWKGKSTVWLAHGSKKGKQVRIYAIDPHTGSSEHREIFGEAHTLEEFRMNLSKAEVEDLVVPIVKTSEAAAKAFSEPVELLFVDGAHEYELVKKDFELWFPKILPGGTISFHDSTVWPGPKAVVRNFVYKSRFFKDINIVDSITHAQKVYGNSTRDRVRNTYRLSERNLSELCRRLHLPKPLRKIGKGILQQGYKLIS